MRRLIFLRTPAPLPAPISRFPLPALMTDLDLLCINTVRTLAMDAVQQAESGHPGTPMALARLGYALFTRHIRHDQKLADYGIASRVVSMPSMELFARQPEEYQREVLPAGIPRVSIEAAHPMSWYRWVASDGWCSGSRALAPRRRTSASTRSWG